MNERAWMMLIKLKTRWLTLLCSGIVLSASLVGATTAHPSDENISMPSRAGAFRIDLESDKVAYSPAERVRLKLTLANVSRTVYQTDLMPAFYMVDLLVRDQAGKFVQARGRSIMMVGAWSYRIVPGQGQALDDGCNEQHWCDLSLWGYNLAPGRYTIEAEPHFTAWTFGTKRSNTHFRPSHVPSSNKLHIEIAS